MLRTQSIIRPGTLEHLLDAARTLLVGIGLSCGLLSCSYVHAGMSGQRIETKLWERFPRGSSYNQVWQGLNELDMESVTPVDLDPKKNDGWLENRAICVRLPGHLMFFPVVHDGSATFYFERAGGLCRIDTSRWLTGP
jgi:hypothetical protein